MSVCNEQLKVSSIQPNPGPSQIHSHACSSHGSGPLEELELDPLELLDVVELELLEIELPELGLLDDELEDSSELALEELELLDDELEPKGGG